MLKRFSDAGGVVEFVFFDCTAETEDVEAGSAHREAVVAGMYVLQQRFGAYTKITSLRPRIRESILPRELIDNGTGSGFAYAFSDTPYGVWLKAADRGQLFEQVCSTVLGGITDDSVIFEWPTDWSSYFDSRHEWWGSFLWSLGHPDTGRIVMIAASTTD